MTDDPWASDHKIYLLLTEAWARALLRNEIPEEVKDMCRAACDWEWTVLVPAIQRPVQLSEPKKRKRA